jgi:hypothetical protein
MNEQEKPKTLMEIRKNLFALSGAVVDLETVMRMLIRQFDELKEAAKNITCEVGR